MFNPMKNNNTMKQNKTLLALISVLMLTNTACCQRTPAENQFTITGTAYTGMGMPRKVYVFMDGEEKFKTRVKNGHFTLTGNVDSLQLVYFSDGDNFFLPVVIEPGATLTCDAPHNSVTGTQLNNQLYRYVKPKKDLQVEMDLVRDSLNLYEITDEQRSRLKKHHELCWSERGKLMDTTAWEIYASNKDNHVGLYMFTELVSYSHDEDDLYKDTLHPRYERVMREFAGAAPIVRQDENVIALINRMKAACSVMAGKPFKDFPALTYPDRKPTTLSAEIAGHVALIDFWASWCYPCRMEIKEALLPLHQRYADKGLVVLGVDVDDNSGKHDKATKNLGITYRQIIDTTQNFRQLYGISFIPQVFLIAADGTVLGHFCYGDEGLIPAVENALGIKED